MGTNRKVYIIDYIGTHCGMHYYDESFVAVLARIGEVDIEVLSNYVTTGGRPFFRNFYNVKRWRGVMRVLAGYCRLLALVLRRRRSVFVAYSFGNAIDVGVMLILSFARCGVMDVHETIAQKDEDKPLFRRIFGWLYRHAVENVILHSERTDVMLDALGYTGRRFRVPHVRYGVRCTPDMADVGADVATAFDAGKTNFLFFGNIMYNKGIDLLVAAANAMGGAEAAGVRIVVAGKRLDDSMYTVPLRRPEMFVFITRHIGDDELAYLYSGTDYVVLPYRKTAQSGIMEMAFHFRRPVIASDIPYFRQTLAKYPSFGVLTDTGAEKFAVTLTACAARGREGFFYPQDVASYEHDDEMERFTDEFGRFLGCTD